MSFSADILKYLRESAEVSEDIESVLESACPTAQFYSTEPYAVALEACNYMDEAYIDMISYQADTNQLMLESVNSLDEHAMNTMVDAINEGVKEKANSLIYRVIQAIKGFITKIRAGLAKHSLNNLKKLIAKKSVGIISTTAEKCISDMVPIADSLIDAYRDMSEFAKKTVSENKYLANNPEDFNRMAKDSLDMNDRRIEVIQKLIAKSVDVKPKIAEDGGKEGTSNEKFTAKLNDLIKRLDQLTSLISAGIGRWNSTVKTLERIAVDKGELNNDIFTKMHYYTKKLMTYEGQYVSMSFKLISKTAQIARQVYKEGDFSKSAKEYLSSDDE